MSKTQFLVYFKYKTINPNCNHKVYVIYLPINNKFCFIYINIIAFCDFFEKLPQYRTDTVIANTHFITDQEPGFNRQHTCRPENKPDHHHTHIYNPHVFLTISPNANYEQDSHVIVYNQPARRSPIDIRLTLDLINIYDKGVRSKAQLNSSWCVWGEAYRC